MHALAIREMRERRRFVFRGLRNNVVSASVRSVFASSCLLRLGVVISTLLLELAISRDDDGTRRYMGVMYW